MTWVGAVALIFGLLTIPIGLHKWDRASVGLLSLAYVTHAATTVVYYLYVQTESADTALYYFDPTGFFDQGFGTGTLAIIFSVQWLKFTIGGSYLDYFLVFHVIGFAGIAVIFRMMTEITDSFRLHWPPIFTLIMFMPGMYFWTSAIGKDAPLFLAAALAMWSMIRFERRWFWFVFALILMALIRPHIAFVAAASFALAVVMGKGIAPGVRVGATIFAALCVGFVGATVQSSLQVDLLSVGSVTDYVDGFVANAAVAADAEDMTSASYPFKLLSLLYRPLFVDYNGVFSLIPSVQNLFMLGFTYFLFKNRGLWVSLYRQHLAMRFATIFLIGMILLLTIMYYNVGLGLRQREMFTPALYFVISVLAAYRWREALVDRNRKSQPPMAESLVAQS